MAERLLIDAHYDDEIRIAVIDDEGKLSNFEAEYINKRTIKGNIYIARVMRIEPSLQAAFIDYGDDKHGFLPFSEIQHSYFKNVNKSKDIVDDQNKNNLKIQDVIKHNQILLVQAIREKRGNKCAAFSTYISLVGRYCVLLSNEYGKSGGISKKIETSEKDRLRDIVQSFDVPEGLGIIIRTAGENRRKQEIKRDYDYLMRLWNDINTKRESIKDPCLIYEEGNIIKRTIRDIYKRTMENIVIHGQEAYKEARTFMKLFTPSHVKKIELYKEGDIPIFNRYGVEEKIREIIDTTVFLPSGGSIVINTTEALTSIDVNSGKTKQDKDIDTTALRTNLEASIEIARQIKLRDIGGLIVIDFIDMIDPKSILKVEKKFKDVTKEDSSNIQIGKISQFGLLELSRQRLRPSLSDSNFVVCPHCGGSGRIISNESVGMSIIRQIENFVIMENARSIVVEVSDGVDLFILNNKRKTLIDIENKYQTSIEIQRNASFKPDQCNIIITEYKDDNTLNIDNNNNKNTNNNIIEESKKNSKSQNGSDDIIVDKNKIHPISATSKKNVHKKKNNNNNKKNDIIIVDTKDIIIENIDDNREGTQLLKKHNNNQKIRPHNKNNTIKQEKKKYEDNTSPSTLSKDTKNNKPHKNTNNNKKRNIHNENKQNLNIPPIIQNNDMPKHEEIIEEKPEKKSWFKKIFS